MSMNASGWTPRAPEAAEGEAQTWTGNRALMLEEALIFEMDCESGSGVDLAAPGAAPSTLPTRFCATGQSDCPACRSRRRCAIIRASAARIMRSISGCSRSARAR
jgi:hypothetical protein